MSKPSHTSKDSYSKSSHFLEHQCSFPTKSAISGKIPDENDCGNCKACGGCPNCGNCVQCASCPDSTSRLCENKRKTDKLLTSGEYLLVSTEDYTQLMDDMITLADLIDELCRMHMEKYTLSQQFRELSSIMSEDEALFVLNAKRMNDLIDERWGNTELIPVDIK